MTAPLSPEQRLQQISELAAKALMARMSGSMLDAIRTSDALTAHAREDIPFLLSLLSARDQDAERWRWFRERAVATLNEDGGAILFSGLELEDIPADLLPVVEENTTTDAAQVDRIADAARAEGAQHE